MKIKLIDKYIFSQVAFATIIGIIVFLVVWISPEILFKIIKKSVYGEISSLMAIKLLLFELPEVLGKAIPVGLILGTLFVFNKLSLDSELTVLRSTGMSFSRIILPVFILSLIGVGLSFSINEYLMPYSKSNLKLMKQDKAQQHFVYLDKTKNGKPKNILIIGNYDKKYMQNIKFLKFSQNLTNDTPLVSNIITANNAKYMKNYWLLENGREYQIASDGVYQNIKNFDKMKVLSHEASTNAYDLLTYSTQKSSEMRLNKLTEYNKLLQSVDMQDESRYIQTKYHQRFAQAFSCIFLAICGAILGYCKPREKKFLGFTIGIGLIFMYYIILPFLDMLAQTGILLPFVAAWIPNLMIIAAIIILKILKN